MSDMKQAIVGIAVILVIIAADIIFALWKYM